VNKALLEFRMRERGKTISDMCSMLGISRSAFYRKCNGISEFTLSEIQKIVDYLNLDSPVEIFFTNQVS
jgi:transcriptional regulator with XRE-family HTH domain